MKESRFIKNNVDSWSQYEKVIQNKEEKPLSLSRLFVKITDDLSYANTYYKNRSVRIYLNGMAKLLFQKVNNAEGFHMKGVKKFYTQSIPLAIYHSRYEFLISFFIFIFSMGIGILSSKYEPDFAQLILGNEYIEMTNNNIAQNDPMAVYKSQSPFDMFFAITVNNTLIAVQTFVSGIFLAIGSIFVMIYNGIMVGAFQYFFIAQGLFKPSFLTIWQHGVLEISSIILAGAAGIVLGKGLLFPGNYTRFQSLKISAHKGLKLLMGIIPILIIAAFIEGFYTRFTDAPDSIRILTILLSLSFICTYFIYLPWKNSRQITDDELITKEPEFFEELTINYHQIYTSAELFMLTFYTFRSQLLKAFKSIILASLFTTLLLFLSDLLRVPGELLSEQNFSFSEVFIYNKSGLIILIISILTLLTLLKHHNEPQANKTYRLWFMLQATPILALVALPLLIPSAFWGITLSVSLFTIGVLNVTIIDIEHENFISGISLTFKYLAGNFKKLVSLYLRFLILGILFFLSFSYLTKFINDFVTLNLFGDEETKYQFIFYLDSFYRIFVLLCIVAIVYTGFRLLYFSICESVYATNLKERIQQLGKTKRIKGLVRE